MEFLKELKFVVFFLLAFGLAGCNTMEGAGEDVEAGGEAVSETARDVEDEIDD